MNRGLKEKYLLAHVFASCRIATIYTEEVRYPLGMLLVSMVCVGHQRRELYWATECDNVGINPFRRVSVERIFAG